MPDIAKAVKFSPAMKRLVATKLADPTFSYHNWSAVELEELRCYVRDFYRIEQRGYCAYCKNKVSLQAAANCQVEHIVPKSLYRNFMFDPRNLCVVCADCNQIKREQEVLNQSPDTLSSRGHRRYPRSGNSFRIVHPHFDTYADHILVVGGLYVDKTAKGHFTIGACNLNRSLRKFGWEPEFDRAEIQSLVSALLDESDPDQWYRALRELRLKIAAT